MIKRVSSWPESELVCNCNSISKGAIVKAIQEKGLTTREQVALSTRASAGCGSCAQLVEDLLRDHGSPLQSAVQSQPGPPIRPKIAVLPARSDLAPRSFPKNLDVPKIKKEGLGLDFARIREGGVHALSDDDYYRLKTYGICGQKHPEYFMMRIRIPGGRVTSAQLELLAEAAKYYGRGWGHLTTRQDMELHWIRLGQLAEIWEQLESVGLSTRSSCGHTMRNVMACPHAAIDPSSVTDVGPWAKAISDYFVSRSEYINPAMPNRLNIFFAGCSECATHAAINDIAFVAVSRASDEETSPQVGFQLWVGGSLGAYPILGFKLKSLLAPGEVLPACQAIFQIHMQHGNRQKGKTRLKFLIEELGRERFVELFEQVFREKKSLPENRMFPLSLPAAEQASRLSLEKIREKISSLQKKPLPPGWKAQRQESYAWAAVHVPLGELRARQIAALGDIAQRYSKGEIYFNANQDIELHWVQSQHIPEIEQALARCELQVRRSGNGPRVTACLGTEFCLLAVTNSQGAAREFLREFEAPTVAEARLLQGITVSVSGCLNSCAKHQVADIGLGGGLTSLGDSRRYAYQLFLGGRMAGGAQLGSVVRKGLTEEMIRPTMRALLDVALESCAQGETFRDVVERVGPAEIARLLETKLEPCMPEKVSRITMLPERLEA